jgi:hypothetical protein
MKKDSDRTSYSISLTVGESKKLHRDATAKSLTVSNYLRSVTGLPSVVRGRKPGKKAKVISIKKAAKKVAKKAKKKAA